jgi:polyphenol oxidase
MPFYQSEQLRYYRFDLLDLPGVRHAVFTRHGGASPAPYASLNHGGTVGDERSNVVENRRRVFKAMGRPVESVFDVWQVHGTRVICSEIPRPLETPHQKADAIVTNSSDITLFMRFADCVPILLFDPVTQVIGIAHAGWQGTVQKILEVTIQTMRSQYGCKPGDIQAGIGPSICVDCYQVGPEVVHQVNASFSIDASNVLKRYNGSMHLDLWEANRLTLERCGVHDIQVAEICTACNTVDWYSHRAESGKTGRFGVILALDKEKNGPARANSSDPSKFRCNPGAH